MEQKNLSQMTKIELLGELKSLHERLAELEAAKVERQKAVDDLRESEEKYRILLDESSDPIFMFYPDGTYRYVNRAFADGVGKSLDQIIGRRIWDVFSEEEANKRYAVVKWVFEHGETKVIEVRVPRPDGDRYYITTAKPIVSETGQALSVICISKEITDRKRMEDELRHLSTHDALTNLYNRHFFEEEVARIQDSRLFPVSIVMMDLDDLKKVNDQHGHAAGDALIRAAAQVLKESFRVEDIIARFGGDEFVVLLPETGINEVQDIIARLRANTEKRANSLLGFSIGSATGEKGSSLPELMRLADDRMYQEKAARKMTRDVAD
jgi:diguanylate cyclase (GGDEF)-like protein/PAS domain S-box-containing protein